MPEVSEDDFQKFLRLFRRSRVPAAVPACGTPDSAALSSQAVVEQERRRILELLARPAGAGVPLDALSGLAGPIQIAAEMGRATAEHYAAFRATCDALRGTAGAAPLTEDAAWAEAIGAARCLVQASPQGVWSFDGFSRQQAVAGALLRLESRGFRTQVTARGASLRAGSLAAACRKVDAAVARLGGEWTARQVFQGLARDQRTYAGSLLYGRRVEPVPKARPPSVPWHWLYNLALKHLDAPCSSRDLQRDWSKLIDLARDLAAALDVETYGTFERLDVAPSDVGGFLEVVVYDELFAFPQLQPKVAQRLLDAWLRLLAAEGCAFPLGLPVETWTSLSRSLLGRTSDLDLASTRAAEHASPRLGGQDAAAMTRALCVAGGGLNKGYLQPRDTNSRNSPYHPLYARPDGTYVMPPRGLMARALYERLCNLMEDEAGPPDARRELARKMGRAVECLAVEALRAGGHEPSIAGGRYTDPDSREEFDIDIAVETDDRIFLIECKKKPLTDEARAGDALMAVKDLAWGFLHMLAQLSRHERTLRSHGRIALKDGRTLELRGRKVERLAVTMLDHGSLQDRVLISGLTRALSGNQLGTSDPALQSELTRANKHIRSISKNLGALAELAATEPDRFAHDYTMGVWWLSIDQLWFLCERAGGLWAALRPLRHTTFRSGDLMTEISSLERSGILRWPN